MSHSTGLSSPEVKRLRDKFGWNELTVKKPEALYRKFLRQFSDILIIVLILAGLIALAFGETLDAIVILCIVVINAVIGFLQEYKTERMLEALQKLVAPTARVIRDGKAVNIPSREVVPGDLLILEEGARVPADAQLIEANELRVDEAILTGESLPVSKFACQKESENCLIYSGTTIAAGSGRALVKNIGANTEFGRVAALTTGLKKSDSPLTREMKKIGAFVGKVALALSVLLFAIGYFYQGLSVIHSLLFSVAVAVAAVPEGLPVTITTALALGMRRLAKKKALVRELKSVETLGGTTVICSDKTGTLTRNQMTVTRGWLAQEGEFAVTGSGYNPKSGRVELKKGSSAAPLLFQIANFCNEANLVKKSNNWLILGDPTEGALKVVARKYGLAQKLPRFSKTFPFDSDRKRMSVVHDPRILSKGAPEQLLEVCTHYYDGKKVQKLDQKKRAEISKQTIAFANQALRVLAFAYRDVASGELKNLSVEKAERNLVFVGLLGMRDAPRPEVAEAVRLCQKAGIRITVATGDNGLTTAAIAREIGIADKTTPVFTGEEIRKFSDKKLTKILRTKQNLIFARVKPSDKLRIVEIYKKLGEIVAVTGDGVNDAPALKRADIGVAMGRTGADVAREAASLVLTDDSFASIVAAVAEGRRIYANMRKFIAFIFSCNIGELAVVFFAILLGLPLPLTAILILLVNLGTDLLPSLALGIDPIDPEIMNQPPRDPHQRIMQGRYIRHFVFTGLIIGVLVLGGYVSMLYLHGWRPGGVFEAGSTLHRSAATFAFATLVIAQLFNAFNFRSERLSAFSAKLKTNWQLWGAIFLSVLMVLLVVELPLFQTLFKTTHLNYQEWLGVMGLSAAVLVVGEARKGMVRMTNDK